MQSTTLAASSIREIAQIDKTIFKIVMKFAKQVKSMVHHLSEYFTDVAHFVINNVYPTKVSYSTTDSTLNEGMVMAYEE